MSIVGRSALMDVMAHLATLNLPPVDDNTNVRLELRADMLPMLNLGDLGTPSHPIMKKYGRRPWGTGRNNFVPHQNTRECARRIVQIAKGQLTGYVKERGGRKDVLEVKPNKKAVNVAGICHTRPRTVFVSERAFSQASKLRLKAIGLHQYDPRVRP